MKTTDRPSLLKEYFLNASLLALALELAKEMDALERYDRESLPLSAEEEWLEAA